jgi:hypothetical protein
LKTYKPGHVPNEPAALPGFIRQEQNALVQAANAAEPFVEMQVLSVAPAKTRAGMYITVSAALGASAPDGFGSGEGLYRRNEANDAWAFIG